MNLWIGAAEYRGAVADGGWFALATGAVGLPAMRDFTLGYCGVLLALIIPASLARYWRLARRAA